MIAREERVEGTRSSPSYSSTSLKFHKRNDGGAITARTDAGLTFRQVLAMGIWDVRRITGSFYNAELKGPIYYIQEYVPRSYQKIMLREDIYANCSTLCSD
jgi:hypothetical protein